MSLFDDAQKIIDSIEKDCPNTGKSLNEALDGLRTVSCDADEKAKPDAFGTAALAIKTGREECKGHDKDFDTLEALLADAGMVECGG